MSDGTVEACFSGLVAGACIARHADDRIFKIDRAALGVVDFSLVQDLKQQVHHIRMRFLDLVKQHHAVWLAAHFLRQLSGLVIAHIARRRTDQAADRVLFHEFRHIQTDKRVDRIEQLQRELLNKLCFAHTRGADEDKAGRTAAR